MLDLIKKTESKKPNILLWEEEGLCMYKSYDKLVFTKKPKSYSFSYDINDVDFENESVLISRKGNKEDETILRQEGVFSETLIQTVKEYLETVNVGAMASRETSMAITKLDECLMWIDKRSNDRKLRGVQNTYKS